jgi:signal transduction histidine kinase
LNQGLFSVKPPRYLKIYLFFAFSAVLLGLFIFSNILISRLAQQTERTSRVFARFAATASFPAARDTIYEAFVTEVIQSINFPIVLTDVEGVPRAWRGVGVDPRQVPDRSLDSLAAGIRPAPEIADRIDRVTAAAERLDSGHAPIPLTDPTDGREIGMVHWGEPQVLSLLRYVPSASVGVIVILLGLTFWGARSIRLAESRSIWVGLAKETAHQLGTPLSSLLGWLELLREKLRVTPEGQPVQIDRNFLAETVNEMESDVTRLNKVAARFSQIGSVPSLELQDLSPVVRESIGYLRQRVPHLARSVEIEEILEEVPKVWLNPELFQWVMENLLVNALNALEGGTGHIRVRVYHNRGQNTTDVEVTDDGRGMAPDVQRQAFETGFTTRKRGWGLGLSISRRIVEEYHGGRLRIARSAPGEGTTFLLSFPT